jgi:predicted outer membrane lipoprotein
MAGAPTLTARLPSDTFLCAAGACIVGALTLELMDRRATGLFVGQPAHTFDRVFSAFTSITSRWK